MGQLLGGEGNTMHNPAKGLVLLPLWKCEARAQSAQAPLANGGVEAGLRP